MQRGLRDFSPPVGAMQMEGLGMASDNDYLLIEWKPQFEIGIPLIDAQHQKLVELCNVFYQELMKNKVTGTPKWETSLKNALHECVDYVKKHFHDEEALMKLSGYEDYDKHVKIHEMFIKKVLETNNSFDSATFSTAFDFVRFLYEWILSHIGHEDTKYVAAVQEYVKKAQAPGSKNAGV